MEAIRNHGKKIAIALSAAMLYLPESMIAQTPTFADVPADHWAFEFIETLAGTGITSGCGDGNYCPDLDVTRAQMAVFLERGMRGAEFVAPAASGEIFGDVAADDFAAAYIEQLFLDGITSGCGGANYCPSSPVTRAQMAVFLLRAKLGSSYAPPPPTEVFGDVPLEHWAAGWIEQLAAENITSGCGDGDYCPEASVTRAQMAVFIVRTFELTLPPGLSPLLYVVGDSLSDTGNAAGLVDYLLGGDIYPPTVGLCNVYDVLILAQGCGDLYYGHSRVTDGPVAVEHLAAHLGVAELQPSLHMLPSRIVTGSNYAVASGTARGSGIEDLAQQVDMLLLDHDSSLQADALYAVIIGGNDAIDALQALVAGTPQASVDSAAIVDAAVTAIGSNVERLLDYGARRLIVGNVPNLAQLPAVRAEAVAAYPNEAVFLAMASAITDEFNAALDARLDDIEGSGQWVMSVPIGRFDLRAALTASVIAAEADGDNFRDACFDSDNYRDSPVAERDFHPDCEPTSGAAPGFNDFVFWDGIHPTGIVHTAVGTALIESIPAEMP